MRVVPLKKAKMARIIKIKGPFGEALLLTNSHLLVFGERQQASIIL